MIKNLFKIFILFFFSLNSYAEKTLLPIFDYQSVYHPTIGTNGMVVSQRELASKIGADILKKGGNAVDAAVATAFALAVVLPRAGNLGGGGFMLVYLAKEDKTIAIDYREKAPLRATRDLFLDSAGNYDKTKARFSLLSAGVPGTVAGLSHALEKYGTMSWSEVIT
ncbi:MAG: gamma-glutamyltransferase, partial [SAR86 cluster bacterium]|nr:gamma-glutamyltransferase [SAR86 cluster bacterium]